MTRSELETLIARRLSDPNKVRFTAAMIQAELDESQKRIVIETRCLKDVASSSVVANTLEYALPADFLVADRVTLNGKELLPTTRKILDFYSSGDWTELEGTPTEYYINNEDPGVKKIGFNKLPQSGDAGTDNLIVEYIQDPADLSEDSSMPFSSHTLLVPYHMVLVHDVVMNLLQMEERADAIVISKIQMHQSLRNELITKIVDTFTNAANMPFRMRGGRRWKY